MVGKELKKYKAVERKRNTVDKESILEKKKKKVFLDLRKSYNGR